MPLWLLLPCCWNLEMAQPAVEITGIPSALNHHFPQNGNTQLLLPITIPRKQRSQFPLHSTVTTIEAMDALWDLEDKLKLSTQGATLVFLCAAFAVIGLCTTILKKKKQQQQKKERKKVQGKKRVMDEEEATNRNMAKSSSSWVSIKKALMGSLRWSGASKVELEETQAPTWREGNPALLVGGRCEAEVGWQSNNSVSPVWQRPILMGEKCELPRFSGFILYDERGRPLHHDMSHKMIFPHEKPRALVTLKDLL